MRFRPEDDPRNKGVDEPVDWADNPLSNFFAWASYSAFPKMCQGPEHWTSRATQYFWTSCPCCLFFRGYVLGSALTIVLWGILVLLAREF